MVLSIGGRVRTVDDLLKRSVGVQRRRIVARHGHAGDRVVGPGGGLAGGVHAGHGLRVQGHVDAGGLKFKSKLELKTQWTLLNGIPLGHTITDPINQMIPRRE